MKKKLSALLAVVLALCMTLPVMAAPETAPEKPSNYPEGPSLAKDETTFWIEKQYVKLNGTDLADKFPAEHLKFVAECVAAPVPVEQAPKLTLGELTEVNNVKSRIKVTVPGFKEEDKTAVPGKYNYKITEQSPSVHTPGSKDTAGVIYDDKPVYIQVVVKYENSKLVKYVTVTSEDAGIGNGNDNTQDNANKKGDFKNKYLLDGEIDPEIENPDPNPNPIPDPNPDPDPITPIPVPGGKDPVAEHAKLKVMKQARGPLASRDQKFEITVTLTSEKPVRSDITYGENKIVKVGAPNTGWTGNDTEGYTAVVKLSLKHGETVEFGGVPAGVRYTVQEKQDYIGALTDQNLNDPSKGYTVSYYGGGVKVDNPNMSTAPLTNHGEERKAEGQIGRDKNNNIIVANSKGLNEEDKDIVKPNTGIRLDSLPYILILCAVVIVSGVMIVRSRRRREE